MKNSICFHRLGMTSFFLLSTFFVTAQNGFSSQSSSSIVQGQSATLSMDSVLDFLASGSFQILMLIFILSVFVLWLAFGHRVSRDASSELDGITGARYQLKGRQLKEQLEVPNLDSIVPFFRRLSEPQLRLSPINDEIGDEEEQERDEKKPRRDVPPHELG